MSNNRSRWMWPVFCAGLLAGNLVSHMWPTQAAIAGPSDQNQGVPALWAALKGVNSELTTLSTDVTKLNKLHRRAIVQNGEITGYHEFTISGTATLLNDEGEMNVVINHPELKGIIAILQPPPRDEVDPPPGILVFNEHGMTRIGSDSLFVESQTQRSFMTTGAVGTEEILPNQQRGASAISRSNGTVVVSDREAHQGKFDPRIGIELLIIPDLGDGDSTIVYPQP